MFISNVAVQIVTLPYGVDFLDFGHRNETQYKTQTVIENNIYCNFTVGLHNTNKTIVIYIILLYKHLYFTTLKCVQNTDLRKRGNLQICVVNLKLRTFLLKGVYRYKNVKGTYVLIKSVYLRFPKIVKLMCSH